MRGASVLFATGDLGVGKGDCLVKDSSGHVSVQFHPVFPATCTCGVFFSACKQCTGVSTSHSPDPCTLIGPWVTSVGGTTSDSPEIAASFSGGGFSMYFPRQAYQGNAVSTFLQNLGDKYKGLYKLVHGPDPTC